MSAVFIPYREVFMNYAGIKEYDIANGPGIRFSLFVSGCTCLLYTSPSPRDCS